MQYVLTCCKPPHSPDMSVHKVSPCWFYFALPETCTGDLAHLQLDSLNHTRHHQKLKAAGLLGSVLGMLAETMSHNSLCDQQALLVGVPLEKKRCQVKRGA